MAWFNTALREILGLFVDDGPYALAIVIWVGVTWVALPRFAIGPEWHGVILFAGLASILLASAWRRSRQ